jgi:polysaccharide export outer membrane protein
MSGRTDIACCERAARRHRRADNAFGLRGWIVLCAMMIASCVGCKTANYSAANLPNEFLATPAPHTAGINLERMVGESTVTTQIGPDDLVQITIVSGVGDERPVPMPARVAEDGSVMVPLVGSVRIGGVDPIVAEKRIIAAAVERGIYRQPHVTVVVTEPASNRVTVLGAVTKPGVVKLPRGSCDLASALAAAGGLARNASTHIEIMHRGSEPFLAGMQPNQSQSAPTEANGVKLAAYNELAPVTSALAGGPITSHEPSMARIDLAQAGVAGPQNRKLDDSDVVMVLPKETHVIHVSGLVKKPDQFTVEEDQHIHVLDAIAMAGGTSSPVADKVFVIRQLPTMAEPAVIEVSIHGAKRSGNENLLLAAGDMVSVESTPATMTVDTISKFFRVAVGGSLTAL